MVGHKILHTDSGHHCRPELERYAAHVGVPLKKPSEIKFGVHAFLIFGDDPCVFFNERDGETGHGCRAWVEHYAKTGVKYGGQHDEAEFADYKARFEFAERFEYETGRPPTAKQIDDAVR